MTERERGGGANLWCYVVWSATEGSSFAAPTDAILAQAKVSYLDMSISIKKDVI